MTRFDTGDPDVERVTTWQYAPGDTTRILGRDIEVPRWHTVMPEGWMGGTTTGRVRPVDLMRAMMDTPPKASNRDIDWVFNTLEPLMRKHANPE